MNRGCSGAAQLTWVGELRQTLAKRRLQFPALLQWLVLPHPWPSTKPHLLLAWDQEVCLFSKGTAGAGSFVSHLWGCRMMKRHLLLWTSSRKNTWSFPLPVTNQLFIPFVLPSPLYQGNSAQGIRALVMVLFAGPEVPVFYKEFVECP